MMTSAPRRAEAVRITESTRLTNDSTKTRADTSSPMARIKTVVLRGLRLRFLVANEKRVKESVIRLIIRDLKRFFLCGLPAGPWAA
jgi:hypothetical protein